jgi:hypothetical protein
LNLADTSRKTANLTESPDLTKEWNGMKKPKVQYYRFWFRNFVDNNDFLKPSQSKVTPVTEKKAQSTVTNKQFQEEFF